MSTRRTRGLVTDIAGHGTFQQEGPWDRPGTFFYWQGPFSSFAALPAGCLLPVSWHGHPTDAGDVAAATLEHWFQATKTTNPDDFAWVLAAPTALSAKHRGSRNGEEGRKITLRPDWETSKVGVMQFGQLRKFALEPFRTLLLATGTATLVERSPYDAEWGGYDRRARAFVGQNLHGRSLMATRAALVDEALVAARTSRHNEPYLTTDPTISR